MTKPIENLKSSPSYKFFRKMEQDIRKLAKKLSLIYRLRKAPPVFIYQMGKVASSSIHHSLKRLYPGAVAHAHHIGEENWASMLFYEWYLKGYEIKIISPIRDPIGFNISSFFQNFESITSDIPPEEKSTTTEMIRLFLDRFDHDTPLDWFDNNIRKHFNIDVYDSDFPDCGFKTYQHRNISLLVFKISIDDACKESIIKEFLDFPKFKLHNRNISSKKKYHEDYNKFKRQLKLPDQYLSKMKNSRFFKHFYTQEEIAETISKCR